ncbi:MAG: hypothetical protein PWR07_1402 [Bacillota bacterium]|nr:hypothetical protein [Bacillota bacterium]
MRAGAPSAYPWISRGRHRTHTQRLSPLKRHGMRTSAPSRAPHRKHPWVMCVCGRSCGCGCGCACPRVCGRSCGCGCICACSSGSGCGCGCMCTCGSGSGCGCGCGCGCGSTCGWDSDCSWLVACCPAAPRENSRASLSSMDSAPVGQTVRQKPAPSHSSSRTTLALPSTIWMAPSAHGVTQRPHPLHFSSSILTIFLMGISLDSQPRT